MEKQLEKVSVFLILCCLGYWIHAQNKDKRGPSAMIYHSLVFHSKTQSVLLFGGNSQHGWGPDRSEVWQYDPKDGYWSRIGDYKAISDSIVNAHAPAYDIESDRIVVFNSIGETWAFDLKANRWENRKPPLAPSPRCGQSMVYDEASDRMVLFGGFGCTSINDPILNDTWTYDYNTNRWEKMQPKQSPSPRMYASMVYNPNASATILWGGRLIEALDDLSFWTYNLQANTWSEIKGSGGPSFAYAYPGMVYTPESNKLVLFGGGKLTEAFAGTLTDELWSFNLDRSKWEQMSSMNGPPPVYLHSMLLIEDTMEILLFGGEIKEMYSNTLLQGTWKLNLQDNEWSNN